MHRDCTATTHKTHDLHRRGYELRSSCATVAGSGGASAISSAM